MTVSSSASSALLQGNGVATSFPYNFLIPAANQVVVSLIDTTVNPASITVIPANQYSITGLGNAGGGTVYYPLSGSPLVAGQWLSIVRSVPFVQGTTINNQNGFYPAVIEACFDYVTMLAQQLNDKIGNAFTLQFNTAGASLALPAPTANKGLKWAADGLSIVNTTYDIDTQQAAAEAAASAYAAFHNQYLGAFASDPALDNSGNALQNGALYWNTVNSKLRIYGGGAWQDTAVASPANFARNMFSGDGTTTNFTLSSTPPNVNSILVSINGVTQRPTTDFTFSGTTLTFTSAPPTGVNNILALVVSTLNTGVPSDGSVTTAKIADGAVTTAKLTGGLAGQVLISGGPGVAPTFQTTAFYLPVRQTVLQGAVDGNGLPTFLGVGSGLQPSIDGSSTTIVLTAANGFNGGGPVDRVGLINSSTSFPVVIGSKSISTLTNSTTTATVTTSTPHGLTSGAVVTVSGATPSNYNGTYPINVTNSTQFTYVMASNPGGNASVVGSYTVLNYLYGDIQSDGSVTLGSTLLQYVYQQGGSYSTTNGQFTFNTSLMSGQVGNGSTAAQAYRVFIGETLAGTSSISSVTAYALRGQYNSGLFPVSGSTLYTKNHNLGLPFYTTALNVADDSAGTNERSMGGSTSLVWSGSTNIGAWSGTSGRNSVSVNTGGGVALAINGAQLNSAYYRIIVKRTW